MSELLVIAVVAIIVAFIAAGHQAAARLRKAKAEYEEALALLEQEPGDNSRRIRALDLGRAFADIAREQAGSKGRAMFDEVALSNDLNARVGTGSAVQATTTSDEKICPECAETVKKAARKCRFCGCEFTKALVGTNH